MIERAEEGQEDSRNKSTNSRNPCYPPLAWQNAHPPSLLAEIYRMMLADRRFGLSVNLIATKVLPLLVPQTVNPQLQYEHFVVVHEVLQEMFDVIDK